MRSFSLLIVFLEMLNELLDREEVDLVSENDVDRVHQLGLDAHSILSVADVGQFA